MRIVIVSDPARTDFYNYIVDRLYEGNEIFLLWHYRRHDASSFPYSDKIKYLYWKDYLTPQSLLKTVRPDRILFFEAIDFWQIPLIIACHKFNVTSFFIEHGVGNSVDMVIARFNEIPTVKERTAYYIRKLFSRPVRILRNRFFFLSATRFLSAQDRLKYLKLIFFYKKFTPINALSQLKFRQRTPHFAILFNRNNTAPFHFFNEIESKNILTGGVPFYDKYFFLKSPEKEHLVFIEHPYLEFNMLDWSDEFHERLARTLEKFAVQRGLRITVKLHPRSELSNWTRYNLNPLITIKQKEDVTVEMLSAKLILGYSSTLINVLISCKKNVVLLGWHPEPRIWGDDFSKTGLCHVSYSLNDLDSLYSSWLQSNLSETNEQAFQAFLEEYNYPFDGHATDRVIQAILRHAVS